MYNVKASDVLLSVSDGANPAHVTSTGDHDEVASIKLDKVDNLVLLQVESDSVVDPDGRIRITNCSAIVCDDVRDTTGTESGLANLEELVSSFFRLDSVDRETALDVVQETVVFARFFNRNNIYFLKTNTTEKSANSPMNPAGKVSSVRTLLSILMRRCLTIEVTSRAVRAYFRRLRRKTVRGSDSRNL